MRRVQWLVLILLVSAFSVSAQEQTPSAAAPTIKLVAVTLLVGDYEKAGKWYTENLGFEVRDNKDLRPGKRWVVMYSKDDPKSQIFLLKPGDGYLAVAKSLSPDRIGKETFWILRTNDIDALVKRLKANAVSFRSEVYNTGSGGKSVVVEDLYGNLWVLQQPGTN